MEIKSTCLGNLVGWVDTIEFMKITIFTYYFKIKWNIQLSSSHVNSQDKRQNEKSIVSGLITKISLDMTCPGKLEKFWLENFSHN